MGGFAAALGGAGNAAMQYGQQMRSILEGRRKDFVSLALQRAQEETDPAMRDKWSSAASDALAGKDFGKILPGLMKAHDAHQQSTQALGQIAQSIGTEPAAPTPLPGPAAPGQVPGTTPTPPSGAGGFLDQVTAQNFKPEQTSLAPNLGNIPNDAAQPGSPIAAQPATNPIGGPQGPIKTSVPQQAPIPTIAALNNAPAPVQTPAPVPVQTVRAQRDAILSKAQGDFAAATPAMRPFVEFRAKQALEALAPFEQVENRIQLMNDPRIHELQKSLKAQGYSDLQIPSIIGSVIGAPVPVIPGIGNALYNPERIPNLKASDIRKQYPGQFDSVLEGVPDSAPVSLEINKITREPMAVHVSTEPTRTLFDDAGNAQLVGSRSGVAGAPLAGLHAAGQVSPVSTGVDSSGHNVYQPRWTLGGSSPITGLGTNPSFIPSRSSTTTQVPGQLPTTSTVVRTKGGGTVAPGTSAAPPTVIAPKSTGADSTIKRVYDDWAAGNVTPTGKNLLAAQDYAQKNGLPTPVQMSAAGQKDLNQVDEVLGQIKQLKGMMEQRKLQNNESRDYYPDYVRYMHLGQAVPNQDLFAGLSFEGLRSAAAALHGTNSRALPIVNRALEHVPRLSAGMTHLPDSPKLIYGKLDEMEKILTQGKLQILEDERKSGVVPTTPIQPLTGSQDDIVKQLIEKHKGQ